MQVEESYKNDKEDFQTTLTRIYYWLRGGRAEGRSVKERLSGIFEGARMKWSQYGKIGFEWHC